MTRPVIIISLLLGFITGFYAPDSQSASDGMLRGVNLAGAEFSHDKLPGVLNKDYIYPSSTVIAAYAKFGMNTIRVPFLWERMQPKLNAPLDAAELARLDAVVVTASVHNLTVILDLHNYGHYRGKQVGSKEVPESAFNHFWMLLATHYQVQSNVAFGLMNEPKFQEALPWARMAKNAMLAIRKVGAKQLILVPGTLYTGVHSWHKKAGKRSNSEALANLRDPAGNMVIEFHHYFDYNHSGTHNSCTPPEISETELMQVTQWLKKTKHRGFLGEFGVAKDEPCLTALKSALEHMKKHSDVWAGWTYWGASEWFGEYPFNIYPVKPEQFPQLTVLGAYLK